MDNIIDISCQDCDDFNYDNIEDMFNDLSDASFLFSTYTIS